MKIKMLSKLRKYDAAIMELGLEYTDKMAIPPGQIAFPLNGYCVSECTKTVRKSEKSKFRAYNVRNSFAGSSETWNYRIWFSAAYAFTWRTRGDASLP